MPRNCYKTIFVLFSTFLFLPLFVAKGTSDHLLIIEVQIQGEEVNDDYIKIYNPSSEDLDISGYKLRKRTSTGRESSLRVFPKGSIISGKGYFFWAHKNFAPKINAQVKSSATLAKNNSIALLDKNGKIIDALAWGQSQNPFVEGKAFPENPSKNQKLIRKKENGLYLDTNNNADDFYLSSLTEKETFQAEIETKEREDEVKSEISEPLSQQLAVELGPDISAIVGQEIQFSPEAVYNPDNDKLSYFWNFGDGQTSQEKEPKHRYSYPGNYLVVLEISDGHNFSKDNLRVSVFPKGLIVSEIFPNPKGKDSNENEWIEIYNSNEYPIDISGYRIKIKDRNFIFPKNSFILGKEFLVIQPGIQLPNKEGKLEFFYPNNWQIQEINYLKVEEGRSLVFLNNGFYFSDYPTPGQKNLLVFKEFDLEKTKENKFRSFNAREITPQEISQEFELKDMKLTEIKIIQDKSVTQKKPLKNDSKTKEDQIKLGIRAQIQGLKKENLVVLTIPLVLGLISLLYFFIIRK